MIGTTKLALSSFGLGHDSRSVVATNVEEPPQQVIVAADYDNRLSRNLSRNVLPDFAQLMKPTS